jgi:hypothetical protein
MTRSFLLLAFCAFATTLRPFLFDPASTVSSAKSERPFAIHVTELMRACPKLLRVAFRTIFSWCKSA